MVHRNELGCRGNVRVGIPKSKCTIGLSSENGMLREKHAPTGRMLGNKRRFIPSKA